VRNPGLGDGMWGHALPHVARYGETLECRLLRKPGMAATLSAPALVTSWLRACLALCVLSNGSARVTDSHDMVEGALALRDL
jgi:hypothetical protein